MFTVTLLINASTLTNAQENGQSTPDPQTAGAAPATEEEIRKQYARSMTFMLQRAKLTRSLAAQHEQFLNDNAVEADMHLIEDASQVMAFDMVCSDETMTPESLDQIATATSYRIAVTAGRSPIVETLNELGQRQTVRERMNLLGDVSSTVFMFKVGRRRGLFDSMIADFGEKKFCNGMRANMRDRYNTLNTEVQALE
jgi:hypothetical protein